MSKQIATTWMKRERKREAARKHLVLKKYCSLCKNTSGSRTWMAVISPMDDSIAACGDCIQHVPLICKTKTCVGVIDITIEEFRQLISTDGTSSLSPRRCSYCSSYQWFRCMHCRSARSESAKTQSYRAPQLSNPWTFAPVIQLRSGQLYNFTKATKNTIQALQHRFSVNTPIMCGACITDKRCQRCQRVSTNRSAVCGNLKHMFCQQCIQDMPDFFNQQRDVSEYTSVSGYNPRACNKMGGPYCWLCWTPGVVMVNVSGGDYGIRVNAIASVISDVLFHRQPLPTALTKLVCAYLFPTCKDGEMFSPCERLLPGQSPSCPCQPNYKPRASSFSSSPSSFFFLLRKKSINY